jgi:hypothetical protein
MLKPAADDGHTIPEARVIRLDKRVWPHGCEWE